MPDITRITQPLVGQETGRVKNDIPTNPQIIDVADPSRVNKTNSHGLDTSQDQNKQALLKNFDSNYANFIHLMRGTPYLTDSMSEFLFYKMGIVVNSGLETDFTKEVSKFMELLDMSEEELMGFVKNQAENATKFNGTFFKHLRNVLDTSNGDLKDVGRAVAEFLKKYDAFISRGHMETNIDATLNNISRYMYSSQRNAFNQLIKEYSGINIEQKALSFLKNEIVPFLSDHINRTHDFGHIRDLITILTLNIAKLEQSGENEFLNSFRNLMEFRNVRGNLSDNEIIELRNSFLSMRYVKESNKFVDKFVDIISRGIKGEAGIESKNVFENIMQAMIIDKSVYIPLLHLVIPAQINGNMFFSEIWADPDSKDSYKNGGEPVAKLLVKFDIKDIGFFETIIISQGDNVSMQLFYPEHLSAFEKTIKNNLYSIFTKNNLQCKELSLSQCIKPKEITEVFPKIYEKERVINVTV